MSILGLDLGQSKSAWAQLDCATGEYQQGWVQMDNASLERLFERVRPEQLVIESGPLAGRVHDLAQARGLSVLVADTTAEAWRWKNVKRKTDRDDALKLVRLAAMHQINPVHMPAPAVCIHGQPPISMPPASSAGGRPVGDANAGRSLCSGDILLRAGRVCDRWRGCEADSSALRAGRAKGVWALCPRG